MLHTVGVLLDRQTFKGIPSKRTGNERLSLYNKAAKQLGLKLFYMSLDQIGRRSALGFTYGNKKYRLERRPIPKVTHNRLITFFFKENGNSSNYRNLASYLIDKIDMISMRSIN